MNKKIFKRLLIATSLLSPVVLITPIILTSCNNKNDTNDNNNNNNNNNNISIGELNSLLYKKDIGDNKQAYWLDVVDFKGESLNSFDQIKNFYDGLVKNKITLINSLIDDQQFKFQDTKANHANNNGKPTNYFADELILTKDTYSSDSDVENLKRTFNGLFLSNVINNDLEKPSIDKGIIIKGEDLNFADLLSKTKIDSKITFIDKATDITIDTTWADIRNKNKYEIVYSIQPKDGYGWKGMTGTDRQLPLVITLKDNVIDISVIDQLDQIKVTQSSSNDEIIINVSATVNDATIEEIATNLSTQIDVDLKDNISNGTAATKSIEKISEFFQLLSNSNYNITITGENKDSNLNAVDVKDNFLTKNKVLENHIKKKRLDFYIRSSTKDTTNKNLSIDVVIDIKKTVNDNYDYYWFGGQTNDNSLNAPIVMKFKITSTKTNS